MTNHPVKSADRLSKWDYFEDPTLPLQIYIRDPQPKFPLHSHGFDELVIILKGTALHMIDGEAFPVRSGDVFVISREREHQYLDMHGLALTNILFDSESLTMPRWDIRELPGFHALFSLEPAFRKQHQFQSRLQLTDLQREQVEALVYDLTRETEKRPPGYRVMALGLFMQLAVYLSRAYSAGATAESRDLLRIGEAMAHIETHYVDNMTLADLARLSHLSTRHFSRVFAACVGCAPMAYLLQIRVRRAAELLRHTDNTITDIAMKCGFSDSNYFTRCFRKFMATTPNQYRHGSRHHVTDDAREV